MSPRDREPAEIGAMSRRVFRALVRRADVGDVEALRELVALQDHLREAITDAGAGMHAAGFTFTYLAAETGVTRQAARKRYGRRYVCACGTRTRTPSTVDTIGAPCAVGGHHAWRVVSES